MEASWWADEKWVTVVFEILQVRELEERRVNEIGVKGEVIVVVTGGIEKWVGGRDRGAWEGWAVGSGRGAR